MTESGHYYTVYYVSLAVGFDNNAAFKNAFFAQLSDEVKELDAIHVAKEFFIASLVASRNVNLGIYSHPSPDYMLDIQEGGHGLTGGLSICERKYRKTVILNLDADTTEFRAALHPFGDSYAHSIMNKEKKAYSAGIGHLFDGHKPDRIELRPKLYIEYVKELYKILQKSLHKQLNRSIPTGLSLEETIKCANEVVKGKWRKRRIFSFMDGYYKKEYVLPSERDMIKRIRDIIKFKLKVNNMKDYAPEDHDTVYWRKFKKRMDADQRNALGTTTLKQLQGFARKWRRGVRPKGKRCY